MYIESKQRAIQFKQELAELLGKYKAEIEVKEDTLINGRVNDMIVYIPSVWDDNNYCIAESAEINLGVCIDENL